MGPGRIDLLPEIRSACAKAIENDAKFPQSLFHRRDPGCSILRECLFEHPLIEGAFNFLVRDGLIALAEGVLLGSFFGEWIHVTIIADQRT